MVRLDVRCGEGLAAISFDDFDRQLVYGGNRALGSRQALFTFGDETVIQNLRSLYFNR